MKKLKLASKSALIAASLLASAQPAMAGEEDTPAIDIDLSVTLANDYRYRGISLSGFDPAIQPDLTVTHKSGVYLNVWGSNIAENGGADLEADVSIGWAREFGDNSVDLRAIYYAYPGASNGNYFELSATFARRLKGANFALNVSYTPSQSNIGGEDNLYLGLSGEVPIQNAPITLRGSIGYENGAFGEGKIDWLVGADLAIGSGFSLGLSYVDTNAPAALREGKAAAVLALRKSF
jgi:uncharacterized protein (TIGR02001 family)